MHKNTGYMRIIITLITALLLVSCSNNKGKQFPDFTATTLEGKTIDPAALEGKTVVVKIWATWCGDCIREIDELNTLVDKYKGDTSVVFLAITDDSYQKIEKFIEKKPFNYQHITDSKDLKLLFQRGIIKEIPEHLVIDKQGNIIADISGPQSGIADMLESKIEETK